LANSSSSTPLAYSLNSAKLTPRLSTVAPSGCVRPVSTGYGGVAFEGDGTTFVCGRGATRVVTVDPLECGSPLPLYEPWFGVDVDRFGGRRCRCLALTLAGSKEGLESG